ncbi:MAG: transporter substrate-binding domain-containing protein, partial [Proteobacteria bacterium]|nr:transporter substrate-binding domain-containing protein [Pseudomonadota bacterium]
LPAGAHAADTLASLKAKGALTVGVLYRVPPFGFVDPATGNLAGYEVDVAKAIAAKLGVQAQFRPVDARTRIPELLEGNIDLIAALMPKTADTAKVIDFSDAYLITGQGFLAKKGTVRGLGDLRGKKIGVMAGSVSEDGVRSALPSATVVPFTDFRKGLEALQTGQIDAASGDASSMPALLPMLPAGPFGIAPVQIAELPYFLGIRKGDEDFLAAVNGALKELERSGEAQKLVDKWFQAAPKQEAGPAAAAAGAIVRRAATPPRVVVVILKGSFDKGAAVSVFNPQGEYVCRGTVAAVFDDQIYVDVDPVKYDSVKAGYAVGMNVNMEAAKAAILKHQDVLESVREQSKAEEEALVSQREQEGIEKEKRQAEADQKAYESKLRIQEERAQNNDYYYRSYHYHD